MLVNGFLFTGITGKLIGANLTAVIDSNWKCYLRSFQCTKALWSPVTIGCKQAYKSYKRHNKVVSKNIHLQLFLNVRQHNISTLSHFWRKIKFQLWAGRRRFPAISQGATRATSHFMWSKTCKRECIFSHHTMPVSYLSKFRLIFPTISTLALGS